MTITIAIEASTRGGSIALLGADGSVSTHELDPAESHASDLMPAIDALMHAAGLTPRALELVVVGRGPGSYTGLRVAAATALGLARGSGAALAGIASFDAIAAATLAPGERGWVVRNAFGGRLYVASYGRAASGALDVEEAPFCAEAGDVVERLISAPVIIATEDDLAQLPSRPEADVRTPRAAAEELARLGEACFRSAGDGGPASVSPLYLRPFDAKVRARN